MNKRLNYISLIILTFLLVNIFAINSVNACKDIIAVGNVTEGDYNLLLKVRDPSRPGLQILSMVPEGYQYTYPHPRTGKEMTFTTDYKIIGGGTVGDTIPNIPKFGMSLSNAGLAFTDSDSVSKWVNYRKYAWDDFDCMRYACQSASNEEEAMKLLTEDIVDKLHASAVSENFFVLGPNKGYVIEEDAYRYKVEEIQNGVAVRHNYAKKLWKSQIFNLLPIAKDFDRVVEKQVRNKDVVRLGSFFGIRVTEITDDYITVKPIGLIHCLSTKNIRTLTKINVSERKSVGYFSVELRGISNKKAQIRVTNIYKAWEEEILKHIYSYNGSINPQKMMTWSRFKSEDLDGLRGMNQDSSVYENVVIYKIPKTNYETLSMGWYVPNHARSSIYVPFHISNTDIYEKYKTTDAAELSLELLNLYTDKSLEKPFYKAEEVFLHEINEAEEKARELINEDKKIQDYLTLIDTSMQRQAYLTQRLWKEAYKKEDIQFHLNDIWKISYKDTLNEIKITVRNLDKLTDSQNCIKKINELAIDIVSTKIQLAKTLGKKVCIAEEKFNDSIKSMNEKDYSLAYNNLISSYEYANDAIEDRYRRPYYSDISSSTSTSMPLIFLILAIFLMITIFMILIRRKKK